MRIAPEPAKALSARQECAVVRAAVARNPASAPLRLRLAKLLNQLDDFPATIALLDGAVSDCDAALALAAAYFGRDAAGDAALAHDAGVLAQTLAATDAERAAALADRAKALLRFDRTAAARALLHEALAIDPANRAACRRLATDLLRAGDAAAVIAMADALAVRGVAHARIFAARMLALAQVGRIDAARAVANPAMRHRAMLAPPAGWGDIAAFNAALVAELGAHPGLRYERHGTASQRTWRIDSLATGAAPVARALLDAVARAIEAYVATLAEASHAWVAARPAEGILRSWCVITQGDGFERWHAHPSGWLSGVYYAQVPDAVVGGEDVDGCIAFGIPDGLVGAGAARAFGEDVVRPAPGMLMLFPSHAYHRTYPHRSHGRRICVSFDVWPA